MALVALEWPCKVDWKSPGRAVPGRCVWSRPELPGAGEIAGGKDREVRGASRPGSLFLRVISENKGDPISDKLNFNFKTSQERTKT